MFRLTALTLMLAAAARSAYSQADPAFSAVPFDQWIAHTDRGHIHWTVFVGDPVLTWHQRLACQTVVRVDGDDLLKRRGPGRFTILIQITDGAGRKWQDHEGIDLSQVGDSMHQSDLQYIQPFFILPGDYRIDLAIHDEITGEHSVTKRKIHVAPLSAEPLDAAWEGLPAVEYIAHADSPDADYLPAIESSLKLTAASTHPVSIDLLVNLTPAEHLSGSTQIQDQVFATLLPEVKIFSQVDWGRASFGVEMIDLARVETVFRQKDAQPLNWDQARAGLIDARPATIDVKALEKHRHAGDFFVKEVRRALNSGSVPHVLIVMSEPIEFESDVDLNAIDSGSREGVKVFYLRLQPPRSPFAPIHGVPPTRGSFGPVKDQLAPLLKGIDPRLIDIHTPDQFRKALAGILTEIAAM